MSLFMAGTVFGDVQVSLLRAGAIFGEVAVSLFVVGAAFGEIWNDRNVLFFNRKCSWRA